MRKKIIDRFWDVYWFIFLKEFKKKEEEYRKILNQTEKTMRGLPTPHLDVKSVQIEIYQFGLDCLVMVNENKVSFWPATIIRGLPFLESKIEPGLYVYSPTTNGLLFPHLETADNLSQQLAEIKLGHNKGGV